jgi:hypothetical protein
MPHGDINSSPKEHPCSWLVGVVFERQLEIQNKEIKNARAKEGPTTKGQTKSEVAFCPERQAEYHVGQRANLPGGKLIVPLVLLKILTQNIQPHLNSQLSKWGKYIAKSDLRKTRKGSTHFVWNALEMMPEDELTKYVRFSQLLVWLKKRTWPAKTTRK